MDAATCSKRRDNLGRMDLTNSLATGSPTYEMYRRGVDGGVHAEDRAIMHSYKQMSYFKLPTAKHGMWVASDAFLDKTYLINFLVSTLFHFVTSSV